MINVFDNAEKCLRKLSKAASNKLGKRFGFNEIRKILFVENEFKDERELQYILDDVLCNTLKHLDKELINGYKITPAGYKFLIETQYKTSESDIVFCAMWFNRSTDLLWEDGINSTVSELNYRPVRIDKEHFTEEIMSQVYSNLNKSKFIIADLTGNRGGVYFEAGYAKAKKIPIIFTCNKSNWNEDKPHFDVDHFPFLLWSESDLNVFKEKLKNKINNIMA